MHGTIPQKICRVIANLASHPQYIPRCLAHNVRHGRTPLDLELPWFSYAAIDFLEKFLKGHMTVCEFGSGGSTLFFARRVRSVLSIEDNANWFERVSGRLKHERLDNVALKLCPFDFANPVGFEESEYLRALAGGPFNIIVVDGSEQWIPVRPICFQRAEGQVASGGLIVVDDSWRYPELRRENRAKEWRVFKSVGPCRPGVTSTDVFFY
jgi:hypothetical protein